MIRSAKSFSRLVVALSAAITGACGDVTSDLITRDREQADAQTDAQADVPLEAGDAAPAADASDVPDASLDTMSPQDVQCSGNADCTVRELPLCHPETARCVECVTDDHCSDITERCNPELSACAVPCSGAGDCPRDEPVCDKVTGFCVECLVDAECSAGKLCRNLECTR